MVSVEFSKLIKKYLLLLNVNSREANKADHSIFYLTVSVLHRSASFLLCEYVKKIGRYYSIPQRNNKTHNFEMIPTHYNPLWCNTDSWEVISHCGCIEHCIMNNKQEKRKHNIRMQNWELFLVHTDYYTYWNGTRSKRWIIRKIQTICLADKYSEIIGSLNN